MKNKGSDKTAQDAQTDLSLRRSHMSEGTFSHVAAHMYDNQYLLLSISNSELFSYFSHKIAFDISCKLSRKRRQFA